MNKEFHFNAIGTTWHITFISPKLSLDITQLETQIKKRIDLFDSVYSRFRDDSLITQISQKEGEYTFPEDAQALFSVYKKLYDLTNGKFTPLIGSLLVDAGYDASYSLEPKTIRRVSNWEESIYYHHPHLQAKQPVLLDFGAGGKGYLVDIVASILEEHTISEFCINAGGDIFYKSDANSLRVGLENPANTKEVIGIATISTGSICGSAPNRRKWREFHHIMDPDTKSSVNTNLATWVVAKNALLADALATALFFVEAAVLQSHFSFAYACVTQDFTIAQSLDFPADFFYNDYTSNSV